MVDSGFMSRDINYFNIRKGMQFKKDNDVFVVIDYNENHVFLVKLKHKLFLPFTRVRRVPYDRLNGHQEVYRYER